MSKSAASTTTAANNSKSHTALAAFAVAVASSTLLIHLRRQCKKEVPTKTFDSVAFFFINTLALTPAVEKLACDRLEQNGITVLDAGTVPGHKLADVLDTHYGVLADRALRITPTDLPEVPEKAKVGITDHNKMPVPVH